MKMFLICLSLLASASTFGVAQDASAQYYSAASCRAYTTCPFSAPISCQVYGGSTAGFSSESQCNWWVVPYQSVSCNGFTRSRDAWGNYVWGWASFNYRCPGT